LLLTDLSSLFGFLVKENRHQNLSLPLLFLSQKMKKNKKTQTKKLFVVFTTGVHCKEQKQQQKLQEYGT